jgi:hypothetical protein
MIDTIGVPIAFVIFSAMALWIIIGCRGYWWLKALFIVASLYFSACLWTSLETLQGWPTEQSPPEEFEIKWILAEEPNKQTGAKGAIYLWAVNLHPEKSENDDYIVVLHNKTMINEPRLYKLPYSRNLHKQAMEFQKQIAKGERVMVRMGKEGMQGEGNGKGGKDGKGDGKGDGRSLSQEQEIIFHRLPPPIFPEKIQ